MGIITFAGWRSDALGITVEGFSKPKMPRRRVTQYTVPGLNGTLDIDEGTFDNVEQSYTVHWRMDTTPGWPNAALVPWANASGYQKLEDDHWPTHYRLARLDGDFDVDNRNNVLGRATLIFECKPGWYRKNTSIDLALDAAENAGSVFNPTPNIARPVITVALNPDAAACSVTVGEATIALDMTQADSLPDDLTVVFDCETKNATGASDGENYNKFVTITGDYPELAPGENIFTVSGAATSIKIEPRWWDLLP